MPKIPGVNYLDPVRALEKAWFRIIRQGKHIVLTDGTRILTVPRHNPVNAFMMGGIVCAITFEHASQRTDVRRLTVEGIAA